MTDRATAINTLDQQYLAEIRDAIETLTGEVRKFNRLVQATQREALAFREEAERLREQVAGCPVCGTPVPGPSWRGASHSHARGADASTP